MNKNLIVVFEDSRYGGPHSQYCNLIKKLKNKLNCELLISQLDSFYFEKKLKKLKVDYKKRSINFLSLKKKYIFKYLIYFFYDIFKILKFLKENNHIKTLYIPGGSTCIKTVISGILSKKKIIWHIHDAHSNFVIKFFYFFLSIFVYKLIFVSNRSIKYYPNFLNKKKLILLPSAVYPIIRKSKNKKKTFFSIGMISNFNPIKNIELFLKIVKKFREINAPHKFYLLGKVWGSQLKYFERCDSFIKKNKLSNLKVISNFDNKKFLNKIDIYVCTSKSESSPLSMWEAMSNSLPILSKDVGDLNLLIKKYKWGYIIKKNDPELFCKKIFYLYRKNKTYKKFSLNAKKTYEKYFNIKKYGDIFYKII